MIAYFGNATALVHGIHMLPITPASVYLRPRAFVKEEWDAKFSDGRANTEIRKSFSLSTSLSPSSLTPLSFRIFLELRPR